MNAPFNLQTFEIDPSYCKFGSEIILKLLVGFQNQVDGVIENDDIERVHKTRVTSRRLRAALPIFTLCFSRKEFKKQSREIKKVTRLLAEARDLDVQIIFIQQYMEKIQSITEKASLDFLLQSHKDHRNSIQPNVVNGIQKLKASRVLENLSKSCQQIITSQSTSTFNPTEVLEKAHWNISFRLDNLVGMQEYVHKENEKLKHHQIRILAKKLRYTMEIFATLYKNELAAEIESIKKYQDVLGEMHDCDVWIDYIPKFIEETKTKLGINNTLSITDLEQALLNFQTYIKERRSLHYAQFVQQWDENTKDGFFVQLKKTTKGELVLSEEKTMKIIADSDVKIAILSDIHANINALERVIQDAEERKVDLILNAGDSIGFGPRPNEVIELMREKNVLSIMGNYDIEVIEGKAKAKGEKNLALKFARKELSKSSQGYLHFLPQERRLEAAGKKILVTHGSPESNEEHVYHDTPVERLRILADNANADIIIVGHSHDQFWRQVDGISFINPGSVGRPGDGNPQTAYAILSFNPLKVELLRLDYDVAAAADALRKKRLPQSFAQMLLRGVSLDAVNEEDAQKNIAAHNCKGKVENCRKFALKYWKDIEHSSQVTQLSLRFFDDLTSIHKLSDHERCWLECASVLHDIGLSKGRGGHNRETTKLILNDTQLPFTSQERQIVASIARYHRKGLPKQKQYTLAALDRATVRKVEVLASLLRVADGLDYTHQSTVKMLNIKVDINHIIVEYESESKAILEEQAFYKKKDLFEKTFAKQLVLVWKPQLKQLNV